MGVSLLLGNDFARCKVVSDSIICEKHNINGEDEEENKELFPLSPITRAMDKK